MKIQHFQLEIQPCFEELHELRITVKCNNQHYTVKHVLEDDDFHDAFSQMLELAEKELRHTMKVEKVLSAYERQWHDS